MLKRFRVWADANPLWVWFVTVAVSSGLVSLFSLIPGRKQDGFDFILVGAVLGPPTGHLFQRFAFEERQARPVPPLQEKGVGLLAAFALLGSVAAFSLAIANRHRGWSPHVFIDTLMVFSISVLLSLSLSYPVRCTKLGQWVLRLAVGWLALLVLAAVAGVVRRGFVH